MYLKIFKRLLDIIISIVGLLITSPVILFVAIANAVSLKGNPFFTQERPGKNEKSIRIIKFKSMNDARDENGKLLPDNIRITPLGFFIRKTSIDELPQLLNVLIGNMSVVGPRPLLYKYIPLFNEHQKRRHLVKPGITGWAQVNGRNSISWSKKFNLDIYYVDNVSFILDVKIIWLTFLKVIKTEGVNQSENRPMQPFNGNN
ncbi:MAG: sugar transferase [Bacteroidia bacterium]|nr:sugar transferase [Bacteroidia bacterium]